ncbi:complement C3-like [Chelmon rostratus]|uniref:complement C3-like n=1 Tax=Chelmon rostratus TaxID=109905 RepID=UPI001BEC232B|nr:complement C3-like [Chelmon rostratus]
MGSQRRTCRTQLWLLAFLAFSSLTDGSQLEVMSAPNLLRVGTPENIFVEIQDCVHEGNINVDISVMNHPTKTKRLASASVSLTKANDFQGFGQITIPTGDFSKDPDMKQYVYLEAQFPSRLLEKIVLVSFQSGYIFIHTDTTIYTPNSYVHYRVFAVTPSMEPVDRSTESDALTQIGIEFENPSGVIVQSDPVSLRSGIHHGLYYLGDRVSHGVWKVLVKFLSSPQRSFSAEFEVKEYVLPSFEVKLTPQRRFFDMDSQELFVNIKATYLSGEEVDGTAYVLFGVLQQGQKKSFPGSLQRVMIAEGQGEVRLKREHITQTFSNILELVGSSIYVSASVLTESGSEMVEAELRGIQIVTSPYTIHFKKTAKYFKPAMPFDVAVEVVNPDGTPAQFVEVVVAPGETRGFTTDKGMATLSINTATSEALIVTAITNDPQISREKQASATMVALPYTTKSNNYIHIGVDMTEVTLGENLKFSLHLNRPVTEQHDITYLILSRGQLVKYGRYKVKHHVLIFLVLPITKEMLPSFRIVAYYHTNYYEVVADSVWVDVKDSCMGSLRLETTRPAPSYEPRRMFGLKITGDPEATVGLVAVDKGVYVLNNKHRLTQKKVWDIVEKSDTGCTPGGGKDSMGVFYDAGLLFESTAFGTPFRQDLKCAAPSRRKRGSALMDFHTSSSEEDHSYMDSNEVVSRTRFPGSWLWSEIKLPACPRNTPNCQATSYVKNVPLQDSITTRQFTGISLSRTHGICVADPLEVIIRKEFYIDLRLPYSAVRGEQLEIKAVLHNYSPDSITVRVDLIEEEHMCSAAFKIGRYCQEVRVAPHTTRSVPFIIIPMKEGLVRTEVKAAVKDSSLSDGIVKMLRVVPEGVLTKSIKTITLDPKNKGVDGKQQVTISSEIPLKDLVPNTPTSMQISVTGKEQRSTLVANVISGNSMGSLIRQPVGSGEQNMIHMTLPVIATVYLDITNQWETVGLHKRNEALQHIKTGYQKELTFRKRDGSFSAWTSSKSSTWLTAYVVKVFAMANYLVAVPNNVICDAVNFLILYAQQPDGLFRELGKVVHGEMIGDVRGADSDASMTAFCLIAMQESRTSCAATVNSLPGSIDKAVAYLERRLPALTNPYAVAMTSYALANENKLNRAILLSFSTALSHWPVPKGNVYTLEATAYALLALVKAEAFEDATPVVRWFSQQQRVGGGYGSTQATIMVYQAVAEYWASAKEPEYDLNVDIMLPGRSKPDKYNFNRNNYYATRTSKISTINADVNVTATGSGEATVTLESLYYALPKEKESDCPKFNLSVQLLPEKLDWDEHVYKLKIEVLFKDVDRDATMSVLEIALLTGFTANTRDLDLLSRRRGHTIARYEMDTFLTERGSLIIYLDKVSHVRPEEITFRIRQVLRVAVLQPAAVSVYEYNEQTKCVRFYHPEMRHARLPRLCVNDECTCADAMCAMQRKDRIFNNERTAKAAQVTPTSRTDFVYKVRLEKFTGSLSTDVYTARIVEVLKGGSYDMGLLGKLCTFVSYPHCRGALALRIGKTYLIMGASKDITRDQQRQSYQYVLGENTWIEYWPTAAECQTERHRRTCLGMKELVRHTLFECRRMCLTQLWLLASLVFSPLISLADASPLKVLSAPNVLRVETPENIFVECQDCTDDNNIQVEISVMSYPTKSKRLASTSVTLTSAERFQTFGQIKIPAGDFSQDPSTNQYVYLKAQFPDAELEKLVLVSFQSGYIYIQTDKTLYTPNSKVHYRMFAVTPRMEPVERDNETLTDASIAIEIVTPEGIILPLDPVSLNSGMHSGDYRLAEVVSFGLWKVVARFHSKPQLSYSAEFEVKEYVLPSFEVKLTPASPFFYVDGQELIVNIKATFLFGEEVDGTAYGVFGVKHEGQKKSLPSSLQRVQITSGNGAVILKREHIVQTFQNILDLVGSSIFVAVGVLTESGSEMVEAELRGIMIVTSPYTIHFKRTSKYFKPGMSFDVAVEVLNPDSTPAQGVAVVVNPGEVRGLTSANGIARLSINTEENPQPLTVTAKTNLPRISAERQASANMTALPYTTSSNSYIHIGVDTAEATLGENLKISLNLHRAESTQKDITYLILSRGQLVKYGRYTTKGQVLISMIVTITRNMVPSFRIIAYYHANANEVVADSVWVDVKDSCMGSLKLESAAPASSYEPRKMFRLRVTGDPGAAVGLVAVDKGVFLLNNKHRLNQKKVWDMVETYDTGCTAGGGKNSMGVFYDAGLLFESNTASGTPYRQELKCSAPSRRKRAISGMDATTSLASQYEDQLQRDCCLDGIRDIPVSYSCERRSEYIVDGTACVEAFLHCCKEMERQRADRKKDSLQLARSEEDDSYMDTNEIVSRTKFPESWLWSDIKLPPCPQEKPNCDSTSVQRDIPLQDSITTWQFTGISLSKTHGICVAEPLEVIVRKDFFIDLRLPYSAVRGEQIEVKAVLYNYSPDAATVLVDLIEEAHVCSAASKRGKYRQQVKVGRQTARSVPFVVIPTREGLYRIEVKAAVKDSSLNDGIMKMLRVVPEGVLMKIPQTVRLDPAKTGVDGKQVEMISSGIAPKDFAPNTPTATQISVTGREQVNKLTNEINGESMGSLIYQPSGCGEENMIHMTLPVTATTYLDKTNQWKPVNIDGRKEALQHIKTGYQNELAYRKHDGSFAVHRDQQSSTWLTAYVVKVFAMANNLVAVPNSAICDAVKFLILRAQQPDGMFREVGRVVHREMIGDVQGTDSDASMTAFCLIAMQESRTLCAASVKSLPDSTNKAVAYLQKRLPSLTNPYAVAMTSYALANENKLNREFLFKFASPDLSHWQAPMGRVYTLEATAYALLALVKVTAFDEARPIVRWFNQQRRERAGYGSTQATIMVYQAVAEYWASPKEPDYDLNVDILLPGRSKPEKYNFNNENHFTTRTSKIKNINHNVKVTATGRGEATVTMVSLYYALPKERESDCQKFNLSVQLLPEKLDENEKIYKMRIEVLFKDRERDAAMSVLDIGMLTGFTVDTNDLSLLSKGRARTISKYNINSAESERGSLIIYLDKVSHTRPEEIMFRIHQKLKVGILQPAAVSVYEHGHHQDKTRCMKFYHPERRAGQLLRLCRNNECTCAEENCSMQKKGNVSNDERTAKACETLVTSKIDYVYKVRLQEFTDGLSTDIYTVRVLEVIKEGNNDVGPQGKLRTFLSYRHCRAALDLRTSKTYLIMGASKDIYRDQQSQSYQYILAERTWIEYWPTEAECKIEKYNATCVGMETMVRQYRLFGCQQ